MVQYFGAHLGGEAAAKGGLAGDLGGGGDAEGRVQGAERPSEDVQVPRGEDDGEARGEGDGRGARVLPAQETVEHAVVLRQWLAGSGGLLRRRLRGRQVLEGGRRLCGLILDGLGDGALGENVGDVLGVGVVIHCSLIREGGRGMSEGRWRG